MFFPLCRSSCRGNLRIIHLSLLTSNRNHSLFPFIARLQRIADFLREAQDSKRCRVGERGAQRQAWSWQPEGSWEGQSRTRDDSEGNGHEHQTGCSVSRPAACSIAPHNGPGSQLNSGIARKEWGILRSSPPDLPAPAKIRGFLQASTLKPPGAVSKPSCVPKSPQIFQNLTGIEDLDLIRRPHTWSRPSLWQGARL